ncbi:hypothetical protein SPRG_01006 [Saprolegnia parasitica CBS 223.65]|uniref:Uncharacterized protein n=1 Tax=Saprolegnia parasitica (strain CBS 223.65) TaxID=695850 RepID=A0A067CW51_SAPPC|nr:hypothetical protein SPRG_01006 [Saprolegnia parasitica CBS 223.65]KDO34944.1 hypothetical protein SPRG_01006 [Saprolegnia parasitica CBS 223.65]|eukprot:XP_012194600.1 hypothetical protein SPRG_01006 [Saprolegnia parasitica CBS 223.65]
MEGEPITVIELPTDVLRFEYNGNRQCWHYGWRSNRFNCTTKHVLMVYIFEQAGADELECIDVLSSPQFTVCSSRRSSKALAADAAPSLQASDDEDTNSSRRVASDQTSALSSYGARRTRSPPPESSQATKRPRTASPSDRDRAIVDALAFWDLCLATMNVQVTSIVQRDSPFFDAFNAILAGLFRQDFVHFVRQHLRAPPMPDFLASFEELLVAIAAQIKGALGHTSLSQWLQLVQLDADWHPTATIGTWLPVYIAFVENMQHAQWYSGNVIHSDSLLMGTWRRESSVKHPSLVVATALDYSSLYWTCSSLGPNTIQVRWDDALCGPWIVLQLEHENSAMPQVHTQLLSIGGLSSIGTEWLLCGTRAWRENQDDTLVIEWYYWPKVIGAPRKRMRERFTLLPSSSDRLMCQLFVEYSDAVPVMDPVDMVQRMLLPANWQVQQMIPQYYARCGAAIEAYDADQ